MKASTWILFFCFYVLPAGDLVAQAVGKNPVIFADVPDMAMIRVGNTYFMSSTTMHLSPGLPIMKSNDLINWQLLNYAYDTLADMDELNLENGKNAYGRGSWASSFRYSNNVFYVTTFSSTTGKTYIFRSKDIEKGNWEKISFSPSYHDHTLFFDDDGKAYLIYGVGHLKILELKEDLSGVKAGTEKTLIENASAPAGENIGLKAEGSQLFKINGKYYLFNITWPRGGMRTVVMHRADRLDGPWESKLGLQDLGVAQGGLIDTKEGKWYAYLFRDYGAVGRIPYLVPVTWENGWPVLGDNGKVPDVLPSLPSNKSLIPHIADSDHFSRKRNNPALPLVWQWNHNPDHSLWSVNERKGFLRLKSGRIDTSFLSARNTLSQRTIGPRCTGAVSLDISKLEEGDLAGLSLLQKNYGLVAIAMENGTKKIVMINAESGKPSKQAEIPLSQNKIYFKADCDFTDKKDIAYFFYSIDGKNWVPVGQPIKMTYTLPHFMGYRYGLFYYATKKVGGYVDFDWFKIKELI